jgi:hypothetical protein
MKAIVTLRLDLELIAKKKDIRDGVERLLADRFIGTELGTKNVRVPVKIEKVRVRSVDID